MKEKKEGREVRGGREERKGWGRKGNQREENGTEGKEGR